MFVRWGSLAVAATLLVPGAAFAEDGEPLISSVVSPKVMDSGHPQTISAAVRSESPQGLAEVRLDVLGASVPMLRAADGRYSAEFTVPPVAEKTVTTPTITVTDGNGQTVSETLDESTVWPAHDPVVKAVTPAATEVEPGDLLQVEAQVSSDSHLGVQRVLVFDGARGVGLLKPSDGAFDGKVYISDEQKSGPLHLTAVAEDANGRRSAALPLDLTVGKATRPRILSSTLTPYRAALAGQPIELDLQAESGPGLKRAWLDVADSRPVELSRTSGNAHRGGYEGVWTPPGVGDYTVTLTVTDVNGRTAQRDLTLRVVDQVSAKVSDVSGPGTLTVSPGWAMLTLTATAKGEIDRVLAQCGDTQTTMTRVSDPTFRQTISLPPDISPGKLDCAVQAMDTAGLSSPPKHVTVKVKRLTTFKELKLKDGRLTGSLYAVDGTGAAYGHLNDAEVELLFRRNGSSTWHHRSTVVTRGHGGFSFKAKRRGDWKVVYRGSADYTRVSSPIV
ncbi:hypothetical protein ACIBG8_40680 [Nonomuraea sp. NPDC050556]|uniref:hypothetical protein n=1 Tax=Nonomuraea sp. NPDC050556 TaxID=3364369 RepID=UPI0037B218C6